VIGPADVTVAEGTHTIVYAWGSLTDQNLQLAVQTIEGLHSAPGAVPGGRSGAADEGAAGQAMVVAGFGAAGIALLLGAVAAYRSASLRRAG
jgi:hypothetical protein